MPEHFRCPTCGPHIPADEDGCCVVCGADCVVDILAELASAIEHKANHNAKLMAFGLGVELDAMLTKIGLVFGDPVFKLDNPQNMKDLLMLINNEGTPERMVENYKQELIDRLLDDN